MDVTKWPIRKLNILMKIYHIYCYIILFSKFLGKDNMEFLFKYLLNHSLIPYSHSYLLFWLFENHYLEICSQVLYLCELYCSYANRIFLKGFVEKISIFHFLEFLFFIFEHREFYSPSRLLTYTP